MNRDCCRGSELFLVFFQHRERGLLGGWLFVSARTGGWWQTEWDIGTIDRDPELSDEWFVRDQYEQEFTQALRRAADEADLACFEIPGATSRWGMAKGLRRQNAVDLANQVLALWERVLLEWETRAPERI